MKAFRLCIAFENYKHYVTAYALSSVEKLMLRGTSRHDHMAKRARVGRVDWMRASGASMHVNATPPQYTPLYSLAPWMEISRARDGGSHDAESWSTTTARQYRTQSTRMSTPW